MKLSILIPTVIGREKQFDKLLSVLTPQLSDETELIHLKDNKEITIGAKRNKLYAMASGEYSVQIDDDDSVPADYVNQVLHAIRLSPDCVGYMEQINNNGVKSGISDFSLRHKAWKDKANGFDHVRTPFHKTPIRTDICKRVLFPDIRFGEDHMWSKAVYPLLMTEVHILKIMYIYNYKSEPHKQKYGIK